MMYRKTRQILLFLLLYVSCTGLVYAENIDPYDANSQYAYGENIGWLNFEPNISEPNVGASVSSKRLTGFIWAENIGWINLSPNVPNDSNYYGITNNGSGKLSGYAWGKNIGWMNFDPNVPNDSNDYGVTIDSDGNFDGWAWGENIGWINFGLTDYYIVACKVTFEDLGNFVDDWLQSGQGLPSDLSDNNDVDFIDFSIFADYWLDYCPDGWLLKE